MVFPFLCRRWRGLSLLIITLGSEKAPRPYSFGAEEKGQNLFRGVSRQMYAGGMDDSVSLRILHV
jgi:hypothetical protein